MSTLMMTVEAMEAIPMDMFGFFGGMNAFSMVVAIVAISVLGGIFREVVKNRKDLNNVGQRDLVEIKQRLAQIEADIADIKEQIADYIIKHV